jgi:AraC-like DNA-binding protein
MPYHFYIFVIGSFLFLGFSLHLLFTNYGNTYLNKLLAVVMLKRGFQMMYFISFTTGQTFFLSFLFNSLGLLNFAYPACFYLYVRGFVKDESRWQKKDLLHFTPVLFALVNSIPLYLLDADTRAGVIAEIIAQQTFYIGERFEIFPNYVTYIFRNGLVFIYLILVWRIVLRSSIMKNKLNNPTARIWILIVVGVLSLTNLNFLVNSFLNILAGTANGNLFLSEYGLIIPSAAILVFIGFVFYNPKVLYGYLFVSKEYAAIGKRIGLATIIPEQSVEPMKSPKVKILKKSASTTMMENEEEFLERIVVYMETQSPYLIADFSIGLLSQQTNIPVHHCSYLLNYAIGKDFRDWINSYRIEYFIEKYPVESQRFTIDTIANQSGFNSMTTFYRAFKKETGKTPSAYFPIRP